MSAEIIAFPLRSASNEGNGAGEAIIDWLEGPPVDDPGNPAFCATSADNLLAFLWLKGLKVVPLGFDDLGDLG